MKSKQERYKKTRDLIISHLTREAIVRSIISREHASTLSEICGDIPNLSPKTVEYHLRQLQANDILAREPNPVSLSGLRNGKGMVYTINPHGPDDLQEVLASFYVES